MTDASPCEVVITGPTGQLLPDLAQELVASRLAASAHVWQSSVDTTYWWKGKIERGAEARLHILTRTDLVHRIASVVRQRHPYEVPHVTATPIIAGDGAFLAWIRDETA